MAISKYKIITVILILYFIFGPVVLGAVNNDCALCCSDAKEFVHNVDISNEVTSSQEPCCCCSDAVDNGNRAPENNKNDEDSNKCDMQNLHSKCNGPSVETDFIIFSFHSEYNDVLVIQSYSTHFLSEICSLSIHSHLNYAEKNAAVYLFNCTFLI